MNFRINPRILAALLCFILAMAIAVHDFWFHRQEKLENYTPVEPAPLPSAEEKVIPDEDKGPLEKTLFIHKGDTLTSVLVYSGIERGQAHEIAELLRKAFNPKDLHPDHEIHITFIPIPEKQGAYDLQSLYFRPSISEEIWITRTDNGPFIIEKLPVKLDHVVKEVTGKIHDSFYMDAGKQGVPKRILHEFIKAFSYDVDFQRGFHVDDEYALVFDLYADPNTQREEAGDLLYATLTLQGKKLSIYRFKTKSGDYAYFNAKGESVRKGLLRTPIDGARISSGYGSRKHPVLGYTKQHKGVDFAAPIGTPIMASGDGVIEKAGPWASYGNYIRIRHNSEFSTVYAHLSRFSNGIRAGKRVKQAQIIGYVGMTGRTTGPHLHYELLRHNVQINPSSIKMLPAGKLTGQELKKFIAHKEEIDKKYQSLYEKRATLEKKISAPEITPAPSPQS